MSLGLAVRVDVEQCEQSGASGQVQRDEDLSADRGLFDPLARYVGEAHRCDDPVERGVARTSGSAVCCFQVGVVVERSQPLACSIHEAHVDVDVDACHVD